MFSTNQKISARQLKRLVILDFFGKGAVFLPLFAGKMESRTFLLGVVLAFLTVLFYTWGVIRLSDKIQGDFFGYLARRLGRGTALGVKIGFFVYALLNFAAIVWAFGKLGSRFVLLEMEEWPLVLLILTASAYLALGGLEVRGRVAETLYPVLFYPIVLLLLFSAFHIPVKEAAFEIRPSFALSAKSLFQFFGVFGGLFGFLVIAPKVEGKKEASRVFFQGILTTLLSLLGLFSLVALAFGERGFSAFSWPVVTLMSSIKIPGGFLERWDVIFTGLLMTGFFISAAAALSYLLFLGKVLFPGRKKRTLALLFCAFGGILSMTGSLEGVVNLYGIWNGCVFAPLLFGTVFLLNILERAKRRKKI